MEHASKFKDLLDTVNLPQGKLDSLGDRVEKIYTAIRGADLGCGVLGKKRQGSWAQRTIINPPKDVEFDADFMLELGEVTGWSAADYNDAVYQALEQDVVYGAMEKPVEAKNRCVRVSYANDMHVDVVPYVNLDNGGEHIINAEKDTWEVSHSDGFTKWMKDKDDLTDGNMRRVIRLMKYLRDHRDWYPDTVSIILTTIVGNTIKPENVLDNSDCYANVPVSLGRIVSDLAQWVGEHETRPDVATSEGTDFTHRWLESEYQQFRAAICDLNADVQAALKESDESRSLDLWQALFGTGFKASESSKKSSKFPVIGTGAGGSGSGGTETSASRGGKAG